MLSRISICLISVIGLALSASADTVEISGGGHLAGSQTKKVNSGKKSYVLVKVDDDITVAIQDSRVRRVRSSKDLAEYSKRARVVGPVPEQHYQLARWCREHSLTHQSRYHMQRVIALDPDHSRARAALKYVQDANGNWVLYSQQQRNRGMISVNSRWQYPEAVAKQRMQEEANKKSSKWIKDIARDRLVYLRGGSKSGEAFQNLKAIKDPLAAGAIASELEKSRGKDSQPRALRMLWVELLGKFHTTTAVRALVLAGLDEPDAVVREAALKQLQEYGHGSAKATYVPMLTDKKKTKITTIRKALRALTYFPDPELAMTYIDALSSKITVEKSSGGGTNAGFTNNGSGGFSTGSKKVVEVKTYKNSDARVLLMEVEPNADYGFDEQAWREHFARKLTTYQGNLRRDQ